MAEQITGFGLAYDPDTGTLRLVTRLTADFDVTLGPDELDGVMDVEDILAKADPDDEDRHDALVNAVTSGDALSRLMAKATGHRRNGYQLDLDAALSSTIELDPNTLLDSVQD